MVPYHVCISIKDEEKADDLQNVSNFPVFLTTQCITRIVTISVVFKMCTSIKKGHKKGIIICRYGPKWGVTNWYSNIISNKSENSHESKLNLIKVVVVSTSSFVNCTPFFCVYFLIQDYTIKHYLKMGADPAKLVLGIPTYGRSYTLFNPDAFEIGSPADGPGDMGEATRENGYLAYYEVCLINTSRNIKF